MSWERKDLVLHSAMIPCGNMNIYCGGNLTQWEYDGKRFGDEDESTWLVSFSPFHHNFQNTKDLLNAFDNYIDELLAFREKMAAQFRPPNDLEKGRD